MPGLTTSCHNVSSLKYFMDKINCNDNDVTKVHNEIIFLDTKVNSHCKAVLIVWGEAQAVVAYSFKSYYLWKSSD